LDTLGTSQVVQQPLQHSLPRQLVVAVQLQQMHVPEALVPPQSDNQPLVVWLPPLERLSLLCPDAEVQVAQLLAHLLLSQPQAVRLGHHLGAPLQT
jgi:hypothetical protein